MIIICVYIYIYIHTYYSTDAQPLGSRAPRRPGRRGVALPPPKEVVPRSPH